MSTNSSEEQKNLEHRVQALYSHFIDTGVSDDDPRLKLLRSMHAEYLYGGLGELPPGTRFSPLVQIFITLSLCLSLTW